MTLTPPLPNQPNPIKVLDPSGVKLESMMPSTKYAIELCGFSTDPAADFHTDAVTYTHFTAPPGNYHTFSSFIYVFIYSSSLDLPDHQVKATRVAMDKTARELCLLFGHETYSGWL